MKKSFTLIEILISITILSILILVMSQLISSITQNKHLLFKQYQKESNSYIFSKVLYYDIMNASDINLTNTNKNYSILQLRTNNSLYNIPKPYVTYYVNKQNNTLIRLATPYKISLPVNRELTNYYLLPLLSKVKIFKIYQNNNKLFIYIDNKKPIFFELNRIY